MINRLINMEVPEMNTDTNTSVPIVDKSNYSIEDYAKSFINGMSDNQRNRFKKMLENNIQCGMSVANNYDIDYNEFIEEVKKQMEV